jgi:hypothetical protein
MSLLGTTHILTLFVYLLCLQGAGYMLLPFFFFFSRLRNPVGLEDRLSSDDYTILILASNGLIVWGVYKVNSESQSLSAFHFVICVFCSFQGGISRAACIQIPVSDRHLIECNGIEYA